MPDESVARLDVRERASQRIVRIDKPVFTIGRRAASDLCLTSNDISKDHAEIARVGETYRVHDPRSSTGRSSTASGSASGCCDMATASSWAGAVAPS